MPAMLNRSLLLVLNGLTLLLLALLPFAQGAALGRSVMLALLLAVPATLAIWAFAAKEPARGLIAAAGGVNAVYGLLSLRGLLLATSSPFPLMVAVMLAVSGGLLTVQVLSVLRCWHLWKAVPRARA